MIKRYRTKPCEIEAIKWTGDNYSEILSFVGRKFYSGIHLKTNLYIDTLEGAMKANKGDYIIKGLNGEFYPCKPFVFKKKYEEILE